MHVSFFPSAVGVAVILDAIILWQYEVGMNHLIRYGDLSQIKRRWWASMKTFARSQLKRFPLIQAPVIRTWHTGRASFLRGRWKLVIFAGNLRVAHRADIDLDKTCWVSPRRIAYCSSQDFGFHDFKGRIIGGDWDLLKKRFDDSDISLALKLVYPKGDESQRDLFLSEYIQKLVEDEEDVTVSVGRHGDLLFSGEGAHRLAIARLLGVSPVPVKIAVRHTEWAKFRQEALFYAREEGGKTYQPMIHPDLGDIPAVHSCADRFKLIKENVSARQGRLLDIGTYLGYFCHRFDDAGFDCFAVEDDPIRVYFLKKLARAENKQFTIIAKSALDCHEIRNNQFDVVLALNIFHHFLKTQDRYDKFIDLLNNLQMKELFFEPPLPSETQMQDAYQNYAPEDFVEFITRHSCLKKAHLIGVSTDGRPLYRLH